MISRRVVPLGRQLLPTNSHTLFNLHVLKLEMSEVVLRLHGSLLGGRVLLRDIVQNVLHFGLFVLEGVLALPLELQTVDRKFCA